MKPSQGAGAGVRASIRPGSRMASSRRTTYTAATASRTTQQQHDRNGAVSPTESILSTGTAAAGAKRKERDYESNGGGVGADDDSNGSSSTNINVVVRCRGRNDREVRENSPVVVSTEGAKGKLISLSMGPNALSDKTYNFDRVFSQAADQSMIFDDVVKPILEEVGLFSSLISPLLIGRGC